MEEFRVEASRGGAWSVRRGVLIPLKEGFAEGAVAKNSSSVKSWRGF